MKPLLIFSVFVLTSSLYCLQAQSQTKETQVKDTPRSSAQATNTPKKPELSNNNSAFRTEEEIRLTTYFLFFGAFVLITATILLYKFSNDCNIAFKYFIIILLVLGMLLLITIGFNENQISPAVGLFGTIAGYLLGRTDPKPEVNTQPPPQAQI
jgi:glycerol uptake facilitator-like aquaporin